AVEVMMITASTSMKLPNVSWPIDSENDLGIVEFGGNSEVMVSGPGSNRAAIYDVFRAVGNMLKPLGKTPEAPAAGPGLPPAVRTPHFVQPRGRRQTRTASAGRTARRRGQSASGWRAFASSDGVMPNMSRNALEKCAELAK